MHAQKPNAIRPQGDLIAAVATAPGRGGVGVIRLSGAGVRDLFPALLGKTTLTPRYAHFSAFLDAQSQPLDEGLALFFPAPHSFTGEDVLELQGHGSPVMLQLILKRCLELGARLAEPGEFSRRAFLNEKIDLAQAESIADLIEAQSEAAARSAFHSLKGRFSDEIHALVDELIHLRMLTEATLDFPEEEDVEWLEKAKALDRLSEIEQHLQSVLNTAKQGVLLREGVRIVLIGQPNVGKSSLLNALAGESVAIVTEIAGTTRDTVRESILLEGVPFYIIDTAGLRETDDLVEKIGIERTWKAIEQADLAVLLTDSRHGLGAEEDAILMRLPARLPRVLVHNKIDLSGEKSGLRTEAPCPEVFLSAQTGAGLSVLKQLLLETVGWQGASEGVYLARTRHVEAIRRAAAELQLAFAAYAVYPELFAEHLRRTQTILSEITGEFTADDLLGVIFGQFCIGK